MRNVDEGSNPWGISRQDAHPHIPIPIPRQGSSNLFFSFQQQQQQQQKLSKLFVFSDLIGQSARAVELAAVAANALKLVCPNYTML